MNADNVAVLLASKNFKRVQYKRNPDRRKPCWYLNFKRQGKRTTRILIYLGDSDVYICWESKEWPLTYKSRGTKLDYGMAEDELLGAMRNVWRDMAQNYQTVELKDRRRPGTEEDVHRAMQRMSEPKTEAVRRAARKHGLTEHTIDPSKPRPHLRLVYSSTRTVQTSAGAVSQLAKSLEALQPKKAKKRGKKVPEEQTTFEFK